MAKWVMAASALAGALLFVGETKAQQIAPGTTANGMRFVPIDTSNLVAPIPVVNRPASQQNSYLVRLYNAIVNVVRVTPNKQSPIKPVAGPVNQLPASATAGAMMPTTSNAGSSILPKLPPLISGGVR